MTTEESPATIEQTPSVKPESGTPVTRRKVDARLVEATPWGLGQWLLASPLLGFLAWNWSEVAYSLATPSWGWPAVLLGLVVWAFLFVLPLGLAAHWFVTRFPRIFQNAGWDVEPLEPVSQSERYTVRYVGRERQSSAATWSRLWLRAAQGWVYLEIATILAAGLLLIPLFMSAMDSGFGR